MSNEEAIKWVESIDKNYIHGGDEWYDEQRHEAINLAIKALEVVEKIKKAYVTSYKNLLGNLENGFTEEMATPVFYHDVAYCINNILCDAYDTEEMMSWLKEAENE